MEGELLLNISQIVPLLEGLLGRPSRWNGQVRLENGLFFAGAARYDGSISISEIIFADQDLRWRTLIHEALHTFSPLYTPLTYRSLIGWEEGVVEQMQRLLRPAVLHALHIQVLEESMDAVEWVHPYNKYILVLEDLRQRIGEEPDRFYRTLLAAPLTDRVFLMQQSGILLNIQNREAYKAALLKAIWALSR